MEEEGEGGGGGGEGGWRCKEINLVKEGRVGVNSGRHVPIDN